MHKQGWVNAHTHLELSSLAHLCPERQPFDQWVQTLIQARQTLTEYAMQAAIEAAIATLLAADTVAVGDISATGLSVEPLLQSGLAGIVYLEVLGLDPVVALERLTATQHSIDQFRAREGRMRVGLTIHAPYSSAPELFREAARWCCAEQVPLAIHIAESPAEVAFVQNGSGPFDHLRQRFTPHIMWSPPGCSPIEYLAQLGVLEAQPLLIHAVHVSSADLQLIRQSGAKVVHCPRSNMRLMAGRMPLERFLEHNIPVALGTDSLASAPSLDIRDELAYAQELHGAAVAAEQLEYLATTGGLTALDIPIL